jgi:hypothetical protein
MFGTYHVDSGRWHRGAQRTHRDGTPHSRFLLSVDRMFYIATAAFAASLLTILLT